MLDLIPLEPKNDASGPDMAIVESEPAPAAVADIAPGSESPSSDRYLTAATVEFEKGRLDQFLWDRALAKSKDDRVAAIAVYLSARATALRLREREQRARESTARSDGKDEKRQSEAIAASQESLAKSTIKRGRHKFDRRVVAITGSACAVLLFGVVAFYVLGSDASNAAKGVASAGLPAAPLTPALRSDAAKTTAKAAAKEAEAKTLQTLVNKIESLRSAGNWNVHVLLASEWTRKEPVNAAAWNELGIGYEKLRQYDDAYAAASKAVAFAPENALYWRNLGLLDVELNLPEEARHAFGQAVAVNDQDLPSMVQIGLLDVRAGRLAEARIALDKAQAANADDAHTLCLKSLIARRQAPSKAPASGAKSGEPPDSTCQEAGERPIPPVVAASSPVAKNSYAATSLPATAKIPARAKH
ncbi:MAG: hypothetical protein ABI607_09860 [Betaproteobacteria bacterium]